MFRPSRLSSCTIKCLGLAFTAYLASTCARLIGIEDLPGCDSNEECRAPGREDWVCNADHACEPPATDMDCSDHGECNMAAPYCDPETMRCRTCSDGTECKAVDEETPICNIDGQCVAGCGSDMDCDRVSPVCNMTTGVCGPCSGAGLNETCMMREEGADYCSDGACVACTDNAHCEDYKLPVCGAMNECVGCTQHSDCERFSKVCGGNGACAAEAEVIYVSDTNGLDTNDCSKGAPCKTIGHALTLVTATRQFIRILDGANYTENLTINGVITIIGTPAARITGRTDNQPAIIVGVGSSVTLDTLIVQSSGIGADTHGIQCFASNSTVTLSGVTVRDNPGAGFDIAGCLLTVKRSLVTGNENGGIRLGEAGFDITNSFIVGNGSATSQVGGVIIVNSTSKTPQRFAFNTVVDNVVGAAAVASGVACTVADADIEAGTVVTTSSIIRRGAASKPASSGNCVWVHSNVEGIDTTPPTTNIDDSCMIEYDVEELPRVGASSPCNDGGEPSTGIVDDYDGGKRSDTTPDMGADEIFTE
jgi:hypothetical protein